MLVLLQVNFFKQFENLNLHSHASLALSSSLLESIPSGGICGLSQLDAAFPLCYSHCLSPMDQYVESNSIKSHCTEWCHTDMYFSSTEHPEMTSVLQSLTYF